MSKFKEGDTVWEHGVGWTKVKEIVEADSFPVKIVTGMSTTLDGFCVEQDKYPLVLTREEALAFRIPEPPREKVEGWVNVYPKCIYFHESKEAAEGAANNARIACVKVREVEE